MWHQVHRHNGHIEAPLTHLLLINKHHIKTLQAFKTSKLISISISRYALWIRKHVQIQLLQGQEQNTETFDKHIQVLGILVQA